MPRVSVVIITYNYARFLPEAVRSVQAQTMADWELIVVDDCSTDETPDIARQFAAQDSRVRYIRNRKNLGEAGSRNVGNRAATGDYIAALDADDWWDPTKLEKQLDALARRPGSVISFAGMTRVENEKQDPHPIDAAWMENLDIVMRTWNFWWHSTALLQREAFFAVGGYDETLPYAVDWDLWLNFLHHYGAGAFAFVPEPLLFYRIHGNNMTNKRRMHDQGCRMVARRYLWKGGWCLRHPAESLQIMRERRYGLIEEALPAINNYLALGNLQAAYDCACECVLLFPTRIAYWKQAITLGRRLLTARGEDLQSTR